MLGLLFGGAAVAWVIFFCCTNEPQTYQEYIEDEPYKKYDEFF